MTPKGRDPNARASSAQLKMLFREGSTRMVRQTFRIFAAIG